MPGIRYAVSGFKVGLVLRNFDGSCSSHEPMRYGFYVKYKSIEGGG